jgi:lipopolysaccharide/colanic/teichoic acid biosynthesis glycosyltransferase
MNGKKAYPYPYPTHVMSNGFPPASELLKRGFDLVVSAIGLLLLLPFFLLIALFIWLDSPGTIFFTQLRGGKGQKPFRIYKFRSMVADAEAQLAKVIHLNIHANELGDSRLYKIPGDPRVTGVGRFLRRYSLDELPQLINVLKGEMSLVGPCPLPLSEDQHVKGVAKLRAVVSPGITGLWQVNGCNDIPFADMMRLDCDYVANWSFIGDLLLLLKTIPIVLRPQRDC